MNKEYGRTTHEQIRGPDNIVLAKPLEIKDEELLAGRQGADRFYELHSSSLLSPYFLNADADEKGGQ